jgi:F-type H+-transporting ATPase subunit delta
MDRVSRPWPSVMDAAEFPMADVYAGAVLANLPGGAEAEEAAVELSDLVRLLQETPSLDTLLFRLPISVVSRCGLVEKLFHGQCSPAVDGLLGVLTRRDRLGLLRVIARRFRDLLDRREGRVDVTVTTAVEMDEPLRRRVEQALAKKLGASPILRAVVDPSLLGGMVVSVGGRVYDDSIHTELERLRERVAAAIAPKERS